MNKPYFVTNSYGRILRSGSAEEQFVDIQAGENETVHIESVPALATHFDGSKFSISPDKPSEYHKWSDEDHCWIITAEGIGAYAQDAREKRGDMLLASDWTQLPDAPIQNKIAWTTYRQALRDITSQPGFPETISWPEKP